MSRELRMVAPNYEHPRGEHGRPLPKHNGSYREAAEKWLKDLAAFVPNEHAKFFWDWDGGPPDSHYYMYEEPPDPSTLTHFQMFETVTEGTPISPVFSTKEELCRWLVENEASAFGSRKATYEQWMAMCNRGWAPSAVITPEGIKSGVEVCPE